MVTAVNSAGQDLVATGRRGWRGIDGATVQQDVSAQEGSQIINNELEASEQSDSHDHADHKLNLVRGASKELHRCFKDTDTNADQKGHVENDDDPVANVRQCILYQSLPERLVHRDEDKQEE